MAKQLLDVQQRIPQASWAGLVGEPGASIPQWPCCSLAGLLTAGHYRAEPLGAQRTHPCAMLIWFGPLWRFFPIQQATAELQKLEAQRSHCCAMLM